MVSPAPRGMRTTSLRAGAACAVLFVLSGLVAGCAPVEATKHAVAAPAAATPSTAPASLAAAEAAVATAEASLADAEADATGGTADVSASSMLDSRAATATVGAAPPASALAALAAVPVKGRAPMTGYSRDQFGHGWVDTNRNGCDTRNDVLSRDLTGVVVKPGTSGCVVLSGTLADPYSARSIAFQRGATTSTAVQVDHVVPLGDAWQTGAQQWDLGKRTAFANDLRELLAVDGPLNEQKGDGDAATWLPPNTGYRCAYVARQVAVKLSYGLWMTQAEKNASATVLATCPTVRLPDGVAAPQTAVAPSTTAVTTTTTAPRTTAAPRTTTTPPAPAITTTEAPAPAGPVVHVGAFCAPEGATGVTSKGTPMVCGPASDGRNRWHSG